MAEMTGNLKQTSRNGGMVLGKEKERNVMGMKIIKIH